MTVGLVGGAALAGGGALLRWFWPWGYGELTGNAVPVALSDKEMAVVRALVRALFPHDGTLPSGEAVGLVQAFDEQVWAAPEAAGADLRAGLQVLEHAPVLAGRASRLTRLPPEEARAWFDALRDGQNETLRQVATAVRQMLCLLYYASPETWEAIGYEGPWVARAVPPESHRRYARLVARAQRRRGRGAAS